MAPLPGEVGDNRLVALSGSWMAGRAVSFGGPPFCSADMARLFRLVPRSGRTIRPPTPAIRAVGVSRLR